MTAPKNLKIKVEYWPIAKLKRYPGNAREHPEAQVDQLVASMNQFGVVQPILVDVTDGKDEIIAGHGRLSALEKRGDTEAPVIALSHLSKSQVRALRLADNRLAETSGWSPDLLRKELQALVADEFDLGSAGFDNEALARFLTEPEGARDREAVPALSAKPFVREGDLWMLGNHRLICGSATDAQAVAQVMGGAHPVVMVTDPPYGVDYDPAWRINRVGEFGHQATRSVRVANDDVADWSPAWDLFTGNVVYVWHGGMRSMIVQQSLEKSKYEMRAQIIWAKPSLTISRGDYHWQHECCWYAVRKGKPSKWAGDRKQTTVWSIAGMNPAGRGAVSAENEKTTHATQKPVECMKRPIENSSRAGDHVYEPFCGSGTTLIACEVTGRKCIAVELSPAYVQVAIERWQKFTGKEATLDGKTFTQVRAARKSGKAKGKANAKGADRKPVQGARKQPAKPVDRPVAQRPLRSKGAAGLPPPE